MGLCRMIWDYRPAKLEPGTTFLPVNRAVFYQTLCIDTLLCCRTGLVQMNEEVSFFPQDWWSRSERNLTCDSTMFVDDFALLRFHQMSLFRCRPHIHTREKLGLCQTAQGIPSKHHCKIPSVEVKQGEAFQHSFWIAVVAVLVFPIQNHKTLWILPCFI